MLRLRHLRLPRTLLTAAGRQAGAGAGALGALRALHTADSQRVTHAADGAGSWRAAGTTTAAVTASALLAAQASAEEAPAVAAAPPPDPSSVLQGLKKISDAKEVVLYQYATCPFCNKARRAAARCAPWHMSAGGLSADNPTAVSLQTTAQGVPGLSQHSLQGGGS
jgi:hypothetical protein